MPENRDFIFQRLQKSQEGVSKDHFKAELQIPLNAIILF